MDKLGFEHRTIGLIVPIQLWLESTLSDTATSAYDWFSGSQLETDQEALFKFKLKGSPDDLLMLFKLTSELMTMHEVQCHAIH